ncbi:MAG: MATE family efflux transporter [Sphaerochaetaceae bacterium]|nr:MATE family efflux transporter [Sphaerochaetaceae bacterium]
MAVNGITEGVIWKQILKFFFPILFGTLFQQLYNTADAVIVGNFLGKEALAAVGGGTATITNLLIGFFIGLSTGATVIISQYYGAKNEDKVSAAVHNAAALAIVSGIIVTVAGYFSSEWMLRAIKTPEDIFPYALQYMHIYFLGASLNVIFNIGSGIFRAFGDSRRPLYFLIVSCLVNIVLDLVFVGLFRWGIKGAAYATVLSQFVASAMVVLFLAKRDDCCKLCLSKIRFNSFMLKKTLYIGFPGGIQSIMFSLSNLLLQSSINYFGTDTAAAWAAYGRLDSIYWLIINAMGVSVTTFVGQNYGAGYMDRARKGVRTSILISMAGTLVMEALFLLFGRQLFLLFTSDEKVIEIGLEMLNTIAPFFFTFIGVEILSAATRGAGKAIIPTLISIFGICILRIIWIETVSDYFGTLRSVIAVYPFSWIVTSILFIAYYLLGNIFPKETKNPVQE